jgi:hypothetical protein
MPQSPNKKGKPKHEETVTQNRSDQGSLNHWDKPGPQGKKTDKKFRQIAKSGLQYSRCAWSKTRTDLVGGQPHQGRENSESTSRYNKGDDSINMKRREQASHDTQNQCAPNGKPFIPAQKTINIPQRKTCHPLFDSYPLK